MPAALPGLCLPLPHTLLPPFRWPACQHLAVPASQRVKNVILLCSRKGIMVSSHAQCAAWVVGYTTRDLGRHLEEGRAHWGGLVCTQLGP